MFAMPESASDMVDLAVRLALHGIEPLSAADFGGGEELTYPLTFSILPGDVFQLYLPLAHEIRQPKYITALFTTADAGLTLMNGGIALAKSGRRSPPPGSFGPATAQSAFSQSE